MQKIKCSLKIISLILIWGVLLPRYVKAQTLNRYVVASAEQNRPDASYAKNEAVTQTLEDAPTGTHRSQQAWLVVTPLKDIAVEDRMLSVFPIPTIGLLHIEAEASLDVQLFDIAGHRVLLTELETGRGVMDLSLLPAGTYLLTLRNAQNGVNRTFKIAKTQ